MKITRLMWRAIAYLLYRLHSSYAIPTGLGICLSHKCNINCVYCMRKTFKPDPGAMTLANIQNMLRRMPYISTIVIQGLCEPFMNPECPQILKWLSSQGYHISFTTNGTVPLTGERLDCLRYVNDFVISIDTNDPETFNFLRGGAQLDMVMQNFYRVIGMKHSLGLTKHDNPPLHINAVITTKNFDQMRGLIDMLEPCADDITYLMVDPVSRPDYSTFEDPLALVHDARFEEEIKGLREFVSHKRLHVVGLDYMLVPSYGWRDCPLPWLNLWVQPNGDVYEFYGFNYVVGNAFKQNPLRAHNSAKARAFRKQLLTADPPLRQCHSCNFARKGWQIHGGYITRSRVLSERKPMTAYEALKHVLSVLSRRGGQTF